MFQTTFSTHSKCIKAALFGALLATSHAIHAQDSRATQHSDETQVPMWITFLPGPLHDLGMQALSGKPLKNALAVAETVKGLRGGNKDEDKSLSSKKGEEESTGKEELSGPSGGDIDDYDKGFITTGLVDKMIGVVSKLSGGKLPGINAPDKASAPVAKTAVKQLTDTSSIADADLGDVEEIDLNHTPALTIDKGGVNDKFEPLDPADFEPES